MNPIKSEAELTDNLKLILALAEPYLNREGAGLDEDWQEFISVVQNTEIQARKYITNLKRQHERELVAARIDWLDEQVAHVLNDIYPEDVFTPAKDSDRKFMNKLDPNMHTRIHCSGIRRGLHILRREARGLSARDDLAELPTNQEGEK